MDVAGKGRCASDHPQGTRRGYICTLTYTSIKCSRATDRRIVRGGLKPLKRIWQRFEEPVLMLAAAGLSAALIFIIYAVFSAIG
ncbi:hypothetical protein RHIZO_05156 [Rhizobiaceae bacterium]|nr:hypothetical protein RHIZO_05156 [Rhizobiaceae bacterium]